MRGSPPLPLDSLQRRPPPSALRPPPSPRVHSRRAQALSLARPPPPRPPLPRPALPRPSPPRPVHQLRVREGLAIAPSVHRLIAMGGRHRTHSGWRHGAPLSCRPARAHTVHQSLRLPLPPTSRLRSRPGRSSHRPRRALCRTAHGIGTGTLQATAVRAAPVPAPFVWRGSR